MRLSCDLFTRFTICTCLWASLWPVSAGKSSFHDSDSRAFLMLTEDSDSHNGRTHLADLVAIDTSNQVMPLMKKMKTQARLPAMALSETGLSGRIFWGSGTGGDDHFGQAAEIDGVWTATPEGANPKPLKPVMPDVVTFTGDPRYEPRDVVIHWAGASEPVVVPWRTFRQATNHKVLDYVLSTSFSPSNQKVAICLFGADPVLQGSDQLEILTYILDRVHHTLSFLGEGERVFWISDDRFGINLKPALRDHLAPANLDGFTPQCQIFDLSTGRRGPVHDFEILASSPKFHRFLVTHPNRDPRTFFQTDADLNKLPFDPKPYLPITGSTAQDYFAVGRP